MRSLRDDARNSRMTHKDHFDPYCDGPSYMLTTDLTKKMYDLSFYTTQFKFEDVYVGVNIFSAYR